MDTQRRPRPTSLAIVQASNINTNTTTTTLNDKRYAITVNGSTMYVNKEDWNRHRIEKHNAFMKTLLANKTTNLN